MADEARFAITRNSGDFMDSLPIRGIGISEAGSAWLPVSVVGLLNWRDGRVQFNKPRVVPEQK